MNVTTDQIDMSEQDNAHAAKSDWEHTVEGERHVSRTSHDGVQIQVTVVPPLDIESWPGPIHIPSTVSVHNVLPSGSLETISHHNFATVEEAFRKAEEIRENLDVHVMLSKL